jgi:hypothetical protein
MVQVYLTQMILALGTSFTYEFIHINAYIQSTYKQCTTYVIIDNNDKDIKP